MWRFIIEPSNRTYIDNTEFQAKLTGIQVDQLYEFSYYQVVININFSE